MAETSHGAKECSRCREFKPLDAFARDRSRPDGRTYVCRLCRNTVAREGYTSRATGAQMGRPPYPPREGDRRQARQRVNVEVRCGRRPHPNTLPCTDCGHVWAAGERRHEYDHHLGYGAEHHYDVQPVCTTCHAARGMERGERRRARGERGRYVPHGGDDHGREHSDRLV